MMKKMIAFLFAAFLLLPIPGAAESYEIEELDSETLFFQDGTAIEAFAVDLTVFDGNLCYSWAPETKKMACDKNHEIYPVVLKGDIVDCLGIEIIYTESVENGDPGRMSRRPYVELNTGAWSWGDCDGAFVAEESGESICRVIFKEPTAFGACSVECSSAGVPFEGRIYSVTPHRLFFATEDAGFRYIESIASGTTPLSGTVVQGMEEYKGARIFPGKVSFDGKEEREIVCVDLTAFTFEELADYADKSKRMQVDKNASADYILFKGKVENCCGLALSCSVKSMTGNAFTTPFRIYAKAEGTAWSPGDKGEPFAVIEGRESAGEIFFKEPITLSAASVELARKRNGTAEWTEVVVPLRLYFVSGEAARSYIDSIVG